MSRSFKRIWDNGSVHRWISSVTVGDENLAMFQFAVILDPLSETAQSWSAILEVSPQSSSHSDTKNNPCTDNFGDGERLNQALSKSFTWPYRDASQAFLPI